MKNLILTTILYIICILIWSTIGYTAKVDELLVIAELRPDEIYKKNEGLSWGDIFRYYFGKKTFKKSYALIVGVNEYREGWKQITTTRKDPIRFRDCLKNNAGFDFIITLRNDRATKERIQYLMQDVFPEVIGDDDRFLFYFSGHGGQRYIEGVGNVGYLPLTTSGRIYSRMISMNDVRSWDRLLKPTKQVLFLLDTCFSGLAGIQPKSSDHTYKSIERLAAYGHHLITAGTGDQETIASEYWGGSIFTESFIHAINGKADTKSEFEKDGVVSIMELMEYVGRRVDKETKRAEWSNRITPQLYDLSGDNEGEFFFITKEYKLIDQPRGKLEKGLPVDIMSNPSKTWVNVDNDEDKRPPKSSKLTITSNVPGARVYINKEKKKFLSFISYEKWIFRGETPYTAYNLSPGEHEIKVSLDNYEEFTETVRLTPGETRMLNVKFPRDRGGNSNGGGGGSP